MWVDGVRRLSLLQVRLIPFPHANGPPPGGGPFHMLDWLSGLGVGDVGRAVSLFLGMAVLAPGHGELLLW